MLNSMVAFVFQLDQSIKSYAQSKVWKSPIFKGLIAYNFLQARLIEKLFAPLNLAYKTTPDKLNN
jgi:hypothetical protein